MDSVKSFFGGSNKASNNLGNHQQQQNGHTNGSVIPNRWSRNWNSSAQHTETSSSNSSSIQNTNHCNSAKRKDSDNYFYIMWHA